MFTKNASWKYQFKFFIDMGVFVSLKFFLLLPLAVCDQKKLGVYRGILDVDVQDFDQFSGYYLKMHENQYKKFRGEKYLRANNGKWKLKNPKARYGLFLETQCHSTKPDECEGTWKY
jgi:hypothetical protein